MLPGNDPAIGKKAYFHCMCPWLIQSQYCGKIYMNVPGFFTRKMYISLGRHMLAYWRGGSVSALPCERSGFAPRIHPREKSRPATEQCEDRTTRALGFPGSNEALSGMGGHLLISEVPGVSQRRFSSEVGYATQPRFPHKLAHRL